ncbi:MAG: hypothetical protein FGF48_08775 [Candidatus Brockarchaeota archaeon]|nr:hypothetical protein [Candidatus Brockarchaeota archaeon]
MMLEPIQLPAMTAIGLNARLSSRLIVNIVAAVENLESSSLGESLKSHAASPICPMIGIIIPAQKSNGLLKVHVNTYMISKIRRV